MAYTVLARKYRPQVFREMVGQEHVLKALINALDHERLHHAYLFTGTRGVGKTTVARVLAKCLNCDVGISSEPCGACASCLEITEGRSLDLIEVDAASRTKVEDTRELLENVQYAPTRSRFKIYLIDEVHMLSSHSFNALLKTLEEPPEHAKFLLATTDPQKLPATILSRCLQFHLKNLSPARIAEYLAHVLEREVITSEASALTAIAGAAEGSMRDALSLTDQAISHGGGQLRASEVAAMLGTLSSADVLPVLSALAQSDARKMLACVDLMATHGADFTKALDALMHWLHQIALNQWVPSALDASMPEFDELQALTQQLSAEDVQLYFQMLTQARSELLLASDARATFDMILLRLIAFKPAAVFVDQDVMLEPLDGSSETRVESVHADKEQSLILPDPERPNQSQVDDAEVNEIQDREVEDQTHSHEMLAIESQVDAPLAEQSIHTRDQPLEETEPAKKFEGGHAVATAAEDFVLTVESWPGMMERLDLSGILFNIASHCECVQIDPDAVLFRLDQNNASLYNESHAFKLQEALQRFDGVSRQLTIEIGPVELTPSQWLAQRSAEQMERATRALETDPIVQAICDTLDGVMLTDTIQARSE